MPDSIILVNGLPGAGKTTLATALARRLGTACLSKDEVKIALHDAIGDESFDAGLGAASMEAIWELVRSCEQRVIVESWWFRPRDLDLVTAALGRLGIVNVTEIWCDPGVEVARHRYQTRERHALFNDARRLQDDWDRWAREGTPLKIGRVIRVDTSGDVDIDQLAAEIASPSGD